jgi:hypothetical protein
MPGPGLSDVPNLQRVKDTLPDLDFCTPCGEEYPTEGPATQGKRCRECGFLAVCSGSVILQRFSARN